MPSGEKSKNIPELSLSSARINALAMEPAILAAASSYARFAALVLRSAIWVTTVSRTAASVKAASRRLCHVSASACAARSSRPHSRIPDLQRQRQVLALAGRPRHSAAQAGEGRAKRPQNMRCVTDNVRIIKALIQSHQAAGVLPEHSCGDLLADRSLHATLLPRGRDVWLLVQNHLKRDPATRLTIAWVRHCFRDYSRG
jgi:DNA-binding transcriptional LysR family regulator